MISRVIKYLLLPLLVACCAESIAEDDIVGQSVIDITYLKSLYQGSCEMITESIVVDGTIIANNIMGEVGDAIFIQDSSAGVEIACDVNYVEFSYGERIRVVCSGLWLSNYSGKIKLGMRPVSGSDVAVIDDETAAITLFPLGQAAEPLAKQISLSELSAADISTLVYIEDLTFTIEEGSENFCDRSPESGHAITSYRKATDNQGQEITLLLLYSCDYANAPLPNSSVDICAIVDYLNGEFILRIVNYQIFG